jgi:predicted DNA-binding antitoxin AbrB/MazE fold protein
MKSNASGGRRRPSHYYDVRWGIALERQARAVKLREGEELVISIIAERVGVSARQVKRYLARHRKVAARPEAGVTPRGPR